MCLLDMVWWVMRRFMKYYEGIVVENKERCGRAAREGQPAGASLPSIGLATPSAPWTGNCSTETVHLGGPPNMDTPTWELDEDHNNVQAPGKPRGAPLTLCQAGGSWRERGGRGVQTGRQPLFLHHWCKWGASTA